MKTCPKCHCLFRSDGDLCIICAREYARVLESARTASAEFASTDWVGDDARRSDRNVVVGVVNVPELMAPDFAIVRLRNGVCLLVGDEGVNVCNTEADMKAGIVSDGLTFQRHSAESPTCA